jgi:hypothetical protein
MNSLFTMELRIDLTILGHGTSRVMRLNLKKLEKLKYVMGENMVNELNFQFQHDIFST